MSGSASSSSPACRPAGAPTPTGAISVPSIQTQLNAGVDKYKAQTAARKKAYEDKIDEWTAFAAQAGPQAKLYAETLAWAAKAVMNIAAFLSHNPDGQEFVDDVARIYAAIATTGIVPPPYGPWADVWSVEYFKDGLQGLWAHLRDPANAAIVKELLELGAWTKRRAVDPAVAAQIAAVAGAPNGEIFGREIGNMVPAGPANFGWGPEGAVLAGLVAASAGGVPPAGPVNAALAAYEPLAKRDGGDFAQARTTAAAWRAAKAEVTRQTKRAFPPAGPNPAPWA